jgi:surfeit locus 1 family protein
VPVRIHMGNRLFAPSWVMTLLMVAACAAFVRLGFWQWDKGDLRQQEWDNFSRGTEKLLALDSGSVADVSRFQRVSLLGRFDEVHQFLLDNRTYNGRAGYEVLTPLERPDGRIVIVDRGWVPFSGLRARLPGVALMTHGQVTLTGRVDELPSAGLASGRAAPDKGDHWPKVTTYPTMNELSAALGRSLESRIVLLDPAQPDGYVRDWHPPGFQPIRYWSYAVQWWAFAVLAVVLWGILSARRIQS